MKIPSLTFHEGSSHLEFSLRVEQGELRLAWAFHLEKPDMELWIPSYTYVNLQAKSGLQYSVTYCFNLYLCVWYVQTWIWWRWWRNTAKTGRKSEKVNLQYVHRETNFTLCHTFNQKEHILFHASYFCDGTLTFCSSKNASQQIIPASETELEWIHQEDLQQTMKIP